MYGVSAETGRSCEGSCLGRVQVAEGGASSSDLEAWVMVDDPLEVSRHVEQEAC